MRFRLVQSRLRYKLKQEIRLFMLSARKYFLNPTVSLQASLIHLPVFIYRINSQPIVKVNITLFSIATLHTVSLNPLHSIFPAMYSSLHFSKKSFNLLTKIDLPLF